MFSHSVVSDSATPWTTACQVSLSVTIFWSLLKLMSIELVMPSNHLILCQLLLRGSTKNIGCSQGQSRAEPDLRREKEKKKRIIRFSKIENKKEKDARWKEELELRLEEETVLVINLIGAARSSEGCWEVQTPRPHDE